MNQPVWFQLNTTSTALTKLFLGTFICYEKSSHTCFVFYKTKPNNKKFVTVILDGLLVFAVLLQMLHSMKK